MTNVNLSDGEWKIMNVLWERNAATITELTSALQKGTGWDKHIIITMLNRMTKKGAVAYRINGRAKQFYPVISRNEVSIRETKGFLNKVYKGSIGMMVNAMVADKALTREDIAELYEILERAEKAGKSRADEQMAKKER
ncbi:MAG: BlaI/MecI/CopY family transcriptional regulator [Blautia sp.]|nr:BlaI/MecI/CopY family transcriptional regulator [Lachnoclostridium sp.]MCM1211919.1 BlaI/MecI/CopY family transcriptional regulator [Blautia sp.]